MRLEAHELSTSLDHVDRVEQRRDERGRAAARGYLGGEVGHSPSDRIAATSQPTGCYTDINHISFLNKAAAKRPSRVARERLARKI